MQWDNHSFASKEEVVAITISVTDWYERYTHQIRIYQYVPTVEAIDTALAT